MTTLKVAILGAPSVGKSTYKRLYSAYHVKFICSNDNGDDLPTLSFSFVDDVKEADCVFLMCSVHDDSIDYFTKEILDKCDDKNTVLIANKSDLVKSKDFDRLHISSSPLSRKYQVQPISCLKYSRCTIPFERLAKKHFCDSSVVFSHTLLVKK